MSHTSGSALLIGILIGGVLGWAGQWLLVVSGNPALVPPVTWGAALGTLGPVLLALEYRDTAQHLHRYAPHRPLVNFFAKRLASQQQLRRPVPQR